MADPIALSFLSRARILDAEDPLRSYRSRFEIEPDGPIYLDGNSLGRMPKAARGVLMGEADRWAIRLARGWGESWMEAPVRLGAKIAPLIGGHEDEIVVCDATSVNLYKLAMAAVGQQSGRKRIVTDALNFPSDLYVLQGIAERTGADLVVTPSRDGITIAPEDIEAVLNEETALLCLTHCAFKSGALHDMPRLTASAHRVCALALWDLSHSAGALPIDLDGCQADLAIGCGYKYLNGGPGAPAFVFVRRDLQEELSSPIWGWLGHDEPFAFDQGYLPAKGVQRFRAGTPPVLSTMVLEAGVDMFLECGMEAVRAKSIALAEFLIEIADALLAPKGFEIASPRNSEGRGSHVSLAHPDGLAIDLALIEEFGVIPDFRAPDNIRFGLAPLYNSFSEVAEAMLKTLEVVQTEAHEKFRSRRVRVT